MFGFLFSQKKNSSGKDALNPLGLSETRKTIMHVTCILPEFEIHQTHILPEREYT